MQTKIRIVVAGQNYNLAELGEILWIYYVERKQNIPIGIVNQYLEQTQGSCNVSKDIFVKANQDLIALAQNYKNFQTTGDDYMQKAKKISEKYKE